MFSVLGRAYPSTQQGQRTNSCGIITRSLSAANLFFISNGVMLAKLKTLPDILEKEGKFLTFTLEFKKEYKINTNFLCCIGFCNANGKERKGKFLMVITKIVICQLRSMSQFSHLRTLPPTCWQARTFYVFRSFQTLH